MAGLGFYKMSGHGNDFVLVDNRDNQVAEAELVPLARAVCRRRLGVGADGMIFIVTGPPGVDFAWRFFNSDGSEPEMCGNGGRCAARFARMKGIAPAEMSFLTLAGVIRAEVTPETVKVQMPQPGEPDMDRVLDLDGQDMKLCCLNTGVPHAVIWVDDLDAVPVREIGRAVRFHPWFKPAGTNTNFVQVLDQDRLAIRTYERGVEDETLACGTGSIAAALLSALKGLVKSPTQVLTRGGEELLVHFSRNEKGFGEIYLVGPVRTVFSGRLEPDVLL